jgi:3-methyladenine DNA glycosylase/8-oxoguanine DNA glycosylase
VTARGAPSAAPNGACLEAEVKPPWPFRLPRGGGGDAVMRVRRGIVTRLLHVAGEPVVVRAWQRRDGPIAFHAVALGAGDRQHLSIAIERMRFALGVDDDYRELYDAFRADRLLGAAIRRKRWHRPRRRPWAWEALAWSITKQLIESSRAAGIQRRMVFRWGARCEEVDGGTLRDVPTPESIADRAPAELAAFDLAPARALALIRVAREICCARVDPSDPDGDRRLLGIREIGPWTIQCLGLYGRGEPDALPAGDLAYVKLVGRLAGLRRRATVEEVEEFFAPYAPYRGLAGEFVLAAHHGALAPGPPLRYAA